MADKRLADGCGRQATIKGTIDIIRWISKGHLYLPGNLFDKWISEMFGKCEIKQNPENWVDGACV